jgi:hypothetical protein
MLYSTDEDDVSYEPSVGSCSTTEADEDIDLEVTSSSSSEYETESDQSVVDFDNLTDNAATEDDESDDTDSDSCDLS